MNTRDGLSVIFGFIVAGAIITAPHLLARSYGQKCSSQYELNSPAWTKCVMKASFSREVDIARR
jgi:hypothetical protein